KGVVNTAVSAAVQAVRGRGRGTLTRGAFVGATAAPGYIAPGYGTPYGYSTAAPAYEATLKEYGSHHLGGKKPVEIGTWGTQES
ncbi:STRBP isoform 3, partial [Pongo abelii]